MTYQRLNALSRIEKFGKTPATVFKVIYNIYFTIVDAKIIHNHAMSEN